MRSFVITALPRYSTRGADRLATAFFQKSAALDALSAAVLRHLDAPPTRTGQPVNL